MRPSERIEQLARDIARERWDQASKDASFQFVQAVAGFKESDYLAQLETDPKTVIGAILMYLDETQP